MTSTTIELDDEARQLVVEALIAGVQADLDEVIGARVMPSVDMVDAQRRFLLRRAGNRLVVARAVSGNAEGWVRLEERIANEHRHDMETGRDG